MTRKWKQIICRLLDEAALRGDTVDGKLWRELENVTKPGDTIEKRAPKEIQVHLFFPNTGTQIGTS